MHWDLQGRKGIPSLFCSPLYLKMCWLEISSPNSLCVFLRIYKWTKTDRCVPLWLYGAWVDAARLFFALRLCSYLDRLYLTISAWAAGCTYRNRHMYSELNLNQPILYVAPAASQSSLEMWHYWSCVLMSLYCFFLWPCLCSVCRTAAMHPCVSSWVKPCWSRNHFCDFLRLHCMILSCLPVSCLGWSKLDFQMGGGDYVYGMIWELTGKLYYP